MKVFDIDGTTLCLALFDEVTNSKELLDLMQAGTLEPELALLNALLIPEIFPVLAAASKTLWLNRISESLKRCGISENSTYVLVARFAASADEMAAIEKLIKGKEIGLEEMEGKADKAQIQKHYKISAAELGISSLADAITCRIASRDAL